MQKPLVSVSAEITETTTRTTTSMRIKSHDPTYLKYLEDHPEAEAMEPDGVETIRKHSTDLAKQNIVTMSELAAVYGNTLPTSEQAAGQGEGIQTLPQKPAEQTTTIGDNNQGGGSEPIDSTYPYPVNPDRSMGVSENAVIMPKLQASGPPQEAYGVRNSLSGEYGALADNQLQDVVQRVEAAVMAEIGQSDPAGLGEESGPIVVKQDGNEALNPDGTLIANGTAGQDAKTQIPQINQSVSIPGMDRTPIGDKWQGNVNDYRENGVPIIMNSVSQKDILVRLLGAYGFTTNDIAEGMPSTRFEQKLGFSIATVTGSRDNQRLEVSISDKTGRPELVSDRWDQLYAYLVRKYPREDS